MSWTVLIWIAIYLVISLSIADALELEGDVERVAFIIAWPLALAVFLLISVLFIAFGLIYFLTYILYILFHKGD